MALFLQKRFHPNTLMNDSSKHERLRLPACHRAVHGRQSHEALEWAISGSNGDVATGTDVHACDYHVSVLQSAGCDDRAADSSMEEDFARLITRGRRHLDRGISIEDDEFKVAVIEDFDAPETVHGGREESCSV